MNSNKLIKVSKSREPVIRKFIIETCSKYIKNDLNDHFF